MYLKPKGIEFMWAEEHSNKIHAKYFLCALL